MRNLKSSHIYLPLIHQLKSEGFDIDLMFFENVPNRDLRYYQVQADIFVDMLTYGFFGATAREAMMLGKPVVCYLQAGVARQHASRDTRLRGRAADRQRDARHHPRRALSI